MKIYESQQAAIDRLHDAYVCELRLDQYERLVFITPDVYLDGELKTRTKTYILGTPQSTAPEFRRAVRAASIVVVRHEVIPAFLHAHARRNMSQHEALRSVPTIRSNRHTERQVQHYLDIFPIIDLVDKQTTFLLTEEGNRLPVLEVAQDAATRDAVAINEFLIIERQYPMPYDDWADQRSVSEREPHPCENDSLSDAFNEYLDDACWPYKGRSDFEEEDERMQQYRAAMEEIQLICLTLPRGFNTAPLLGDFREVLHTFEILSGNTFDTLRALDQHYKWMDGGKFREVFIDYLNWRLHDTAPRP